MELIQQFMPFEAFTILVLVAVFVFATYFKINIGLVALLAAYFLGAGLLDMDAKEIVSAFPDNIFMLILGLTLLMGIANLNGSVAWLVNRLVKLSGGNLALLPISMFVICILVSSFGAAVAPILFVIGLKFAVQYKINPLLLGAMVLHGTQAGFFSPISPYGLLFDSLSEKSGFSISPWILYFQVCLAHMLLAVVIFFAMGGRQLLSRKVDKAVLQASIDDAGPLSPVQLVTLIGLLCFLLGVTVLQMNAGFLAICISIFILLFSDEDVKLESINKIAWAVLLIITGVLILVGVLQNAGVFTWLAEQTQVMGSPIWIALFLCVLAAAATAVSSTFGTFSILVPLVAPFVLAGDINGTALLVAIAISAAVTDICPFSPWGAMFLGYADPAQRQTLMRQMLRYTGVLILVVPLISWLVLLVLPQLF